MKSQIEYWLEKDFDGLYTNYDDPWGCTHNFLSFNNELFLSLLNEYSIGYNRILDIGCGLGKLTKEIYTFCATPDGEVVGIDVSNVAIQKIKNKNTPFLQFFCKNILTDSIDDLGIFDLIIMSEVLWYVCDDLPGVFAKIESALSKNGIFALHQYFPEQQKYYMDKLNGLAGWENFVKENKWESVNQIIAQSEEGAVLLALYKKQ